MRPSFASLLLVVAFVSSVLVKQIIDAPVELDVHPFAETRSNEDLSKALRWYFNNSPSSAAIRSKTVLILPKLELGQTTQQRSAYNYYVELNEIARVAEFAEGDLWWLSSTSASKQSSTPTLAGFDLFSYSLVEIKEQHLAPIEEAYALKLKAIVKVEQLSSFAKLLKKHDISIFSTDGRPLPWEKIEKSIAGTLPAEFYFQRSKYGYFLPLPRPVVRLSDLSTATSRPER